MADTIEAGDYVECIASGASGGFLAEGLTYRVEWVTKGLTGLVFYLKLEGSDTAWMASRFKKVPQLDGLHG